MLSVRTALALSVSLLAAGCAHLEPPQPLRLVGKQTQWVARTESGPVVIRRSLTPYSVPKGVLQPLVPMPGVHPATEIDVLQAINDPDTLLIDLRDEEGPSPPTIPNAYAIPYPDIEDRLDELGCTRTGPARWDCARAPRVIVFDYGPMCVQAAAGIQRMVHVGFPVDRIGYYRGGMMAWQAIGLTTVTGYRQPRR